MEDRNKSYYHLGPWDFGALCLFAWVGVKLGVAYFDSKKKVVRVKNNNYVLIEEEK